MSHSEQIDAGFMKIALAAPRGVGKTSVLTALLREANEVLAGTRVSVEATGETRKRLNKLRNSLNGHLRAREFVPEGIGGTQDCAQFSLEIRSAGTDRAYGLEFLDYPGGLLEEQAGAQWADVKGWFRDAEVLILPLDATLLMEAATAWQHQRAEALLNVSEIESIAARQWAKERHVAGLAPGLLVLAPVKCEYYFADNGGSQDRADELWERARSVYGHVVDAVRSECPEVDVLYCPIDTIGCVEAIRVQWPARGDEEGRPVAHYRVRGEGQLRPKGAADLFIVLVRRILDRAREQQSKTAQDAQRDARNAQIEALTDHGLLVNLWMRITGERSELNEGAARAIAVAEVESAVLMELQKTLEEVAKRPLGARVRLDME